MEKKTKQRLEQLVRQGIVPSGKLPMLMQAMSSLHMGKQLSPTERKVLDKYMFNMTDIMLKDTTVFNRAKLHTQRTKYQTEETTVEIDENVRVVDGEEDMEVRGREKEEMKAKRLSIRKRDKYRLLSPELKKEKKKAGLDEDVVDLNNTYQEMFEATLEYFEVSNIRDLPEDKKKEFFATIDEALEEAKMAKKDHDGDGKVETSTAEYMGSRDKAIKKAMKKESFEDNEKRREKARADMAAGKYNKDGSRKVVKLKGFGPDGAKGNMSNPAARASLMRKEEWEWLEEADNISHKHLQKLYATKDLETAKHHARNMVNSWKETSKKKVTKDKVDFHHRQIDKHDSVHKVQKHMTDLALSGEGHGVIGSKYSTKKNAYRGKFRDPGHGPTARRAHGTIYQEFEMTVDTLLDEAMTPEFKAKRLEMIRQAHDRVMTGKTRDAAKAKAAAKSAMKQKGSQKGMAPTKKDVEEQVKELRKMIREGTDKIESYKLLAKILNNKETLGE